MKFLSKALRVLLAGLVLTFGRANAATGDSPPTLDPEFSAGLALLKQASGFIEDSRSATDWKPNLQLLVGVKAVEASKRTIYFVQLTTLSPQPTNSQVQPWQPSLRTNEWAWSATNTAQFVTAVYPVRVRVFDEAGRRLKEGQTPMAWGMLTNGLRDMCRVSLETYGNQTNPPNRLDGGKPSDAPKLLDNEQLARATGGGFLWMFGMLHDLQTVPAVANVWSKAQCAFRWPSAWTVVKSVFTGLDLSLEARLKEVTLVTAADASRAEAVYRLPLDLKSGKRHLTSVEIVIGPAYGAQMLLAGIRSVRATHPTKPEQEFLAQVLATGTVCEP